MVLDFSNEGKEKMTQDKLNEHQDKINIKIIDNLNTITTLLDSIMKDLKQLGRNLEENKK